jgi:hypothetical protein
MPMNPIFLPWKRRIAYGLKNGFALSLLTTLAAR